MTKTWLKYWNSPESSKLDELFETSENVARSILYQLNARKNNTICEFGCGKGKLLSLIEKSVELSVGIDFAENRIKGVKSKFLLNDSFNVQLKNDCIDRTYCFSLFNFLTLEESIATLEEMLRVTKKGGFVLIGDVLKEEAEKILYIKMRENSIKCPALTFYNPKVFEKIIENIVSDNSVFTVYDTKIDNYTNNDISFNGLIWKK